MFCIQWWFFCFRASTKVLWLRASVNTWILHPKAPCFFLRTPSSKAALWKALSLCLSQTSGGCGPGDRHYFSVPCLLAASLLPTAQAPWQPRGASFTLPSCWVPVCNFFSTQSPTLFAKWAKKFTDAAAVTTKAISVADNIDPESCLDSSGLWSHRPLASGLETPETIFIR